MFDDPQQPGQSPQPTQQPDPNQPPTTEGAPDPAGVPAPEEVKYKSVDYGPSAVETGKLKPVTADTPKDTGMPGEGVSIYELKAPMTQSKIFMIGLVVVVAVLVIAGGYWVFNSLMSGDDVDVVETIVPPEANIEDIEDEEEEQEDINDTDSLIIEDAPIVEPEPKDNTIIPEVDETIVIPEPEPSALLDSDFDGITDDVEIQYGTDWNNPDTDGDGLNDKEELEIWGTDPLNPDTDGDTYEDGSEINAGYNPKGAGKLLKVPTN